MPGPDETSGGGRPDPSWRPAAPDVTESRNGELRLEQFVGVRSDDNSVGRWGRLIETRGGSILLDTTHIKSSRFEWRADGSLLFWCEDRNSQGLFRIDPEKRVFRNLARRDGDRPLSSLAAEVDAEAARLARGGDDDTPNYGYVKRRFSPDGTVMAEFFLQEWRMSHWTESPKIVLVETGEILLNLADDWDASVTFQDHGPLFLALRRYHAPWPITLTIDPEARTGLIGSEGERPRPLPGIEPALETAHRKARKVVAGAPAAAPPAQIRPSFGQRMKTFGIGLLLGLVLIVAIGFGSYVWHEGWPG